MNTFVYVIDFPAVVAADDCVLHSEAVQVCYGGLLSLGLQIVGHDEAAVFHQLGDIGGLSTRCSGHVQYLLPRQRSERHHYVKYADINLIERAITVLNQDSKKPLTAACRSLRGIQEWLRWEQWTRSL